MNPPKRRSNDNNNKPKIKLANTKQINEKTNELK